MDKKLSYLDENLTFDERARDLVSRMTLQEKVTQMLYKSPAVKRLGIPSYNWWNEALHGVARAGVATVFPQAIGLAATFDEDAVYRTADIISTEGRAKYNEAQRRGDHGIFKGLTFWSPNVNIFRDPRWGRGQETYGEDPYLTARLGCAFVRGLQGSDKRYLKSAACAKHFAVHSGPEKLRHSFNAVVSEKDLRETYLYAFRQLVKEADVEGVMGAYNRVNGEPWSGSGTLLVKILRGEWGFKGYVTSDCWAIRDFHERHMVTKTAPESVALAVNSGCDTNCGDMYANLLIAHKEGLVSEEAIDKCVVRLMTTRMKLGMFDDPSHVPYASIPYSANDSRENAEYNLKTAEETLVLLKNENGFLPLDKGKLSSIAVVGPNADSRAALEGNYCGTSSEYVTVLEGIREYAGDSVRINYAQGCALNSDRTDHLAEKGDRIQEAVSVALHSDVTVVCLGLDAGIEGEEGDESNSFAGGDKNDLSLPESQRDLLRALCETAKPVALVLLAGSALTINYAAAHVRAIVDAFYPGAQGGRAVARMLFGEYSPAGRLPVTFYRTSEELPEFTDYSMEGRTYRYMKNKALYPFGFGLSYTDFKYGSLRLSKTELQAGETVLCAIMVENCGKMASKEKVQLYIRDEKASVRVPRWQLCGFRSVFLGPGEKAEVKFEIPPRLMAVIEDDGNCVLEPGGFTVYAGPCQPDERSRELMGNKVMTASFAVSGGPLPLEY